MSSFKDEEWNDRVAILGDPAEKKFQEWAARSGIGCVKYGLDRPPVNLSRVSAFVRYTPDFLTDNGLVEVQGCGSDQLMKFKHDKLQALMQWQRRDHVNVWLWNQPLDDWRQLPVLRIVAMCQQHPRPGGRHVSLFREDGVFDGSKPYASVPWIDLI